jgi:hypothetical protein
LRAAVGSFAEAGSCSNMPWYSLKSLAEEKLDMPHAADG